MDEIPEPPKRHRLRHRGVLRWYGIPSINRSQYILDDVSGRGIFVSLVVQDFFHQVHND